MTPPVQNPSSNNRKPINPPSEVPLSQATNSTQTKNSDQKSVQTPQKTAPAPSKVPPKKVEEKNPLEIQLQQFVFAEQMTSKYKSTVKSLEILFPKIKDIFAKISQGKTKTGSFDGLTKKAAEIGKKSTSDLLGSHSHVSDDFVKDIEGCVEFLQSIDFDPKKMREEVKEECKREYDLKIKQEVAKVKNFKDVAISDRLVSLLQQENKELEEFKASLELKFAVEYKDLFGKELQRLEKQQDFFKVATDNAGYE